MGQTGRWGTGADRRAARWNAVALALVALVALIAAIAAAAPAAAQDEPLPEIYSEWHQERIAALDALFTEVGCPAVGLNVTREPETTTSQVIQGFVSDSESIPLLIVAEQPSLRCTYLNPNTDRDSWFEVFFVRDGESNDFLCTAERQENQTVELGNLDPTRAIAGRFFADPGLTAPERLEDAARAMVPVLAPAARGCPEDPVAVTCPDVPDYTTPEPGITEFSGAADTYTVSCFYDPADEAASPRITYDIQVSWIPPLATSSARFESLCATETAFDRGWGTISGDGLAIGAIYGIASPTPVDPTPAETATRALIAQVAGQAQSCDAVDFVPRSQQFTPVPAPYAPAFAPELVSGAGPPVIETEPPAEPPPGDASADAPATESAAPAPAPTRSGSSLSSGLATLLRIVTIVLLVVSLLGLLLAFLLIRRETRVRPKIDAARLLIVLATAVVMMLVFSKGAPLWAVGVAVAAGLGLGFLQGQTLSVRLTEAGLMARRTAWAIAAFAAGLVLSQIAGLLNRTGAIAVGIALSFLSAALTAGLIAGRQPRLAEARRAAAGTALVALVAVPLVPMAFGSGEARAAQEPRLEIAAVPPEERTAEIDALIDFVPWDAAEIGGGLWWTNGKPWAPAPVPRALDGVPEPVTRTVSWSAIPNTGAPGPTEYTVTETFEFSARGDGFCCSVTYSGEGVMTPFEREPEEWVASGRLDDIQSVAVEGSGPFNPSNFGGQPFTEVGEWDAPLDAPAPTVCRRAVGITRNQRLLEDGGGLADVTVGVDGDADAGFMDTSLVVGIPCDIPGLSLEAALAEAPPPPPQDAEERQGCPVIQETLAALSAGTTFPGFDARTLSDAFLTPNQSICEYGALIAPPAIGQGGRGNTRMEFAVDVARPPQGEWDLGYTRWGSMDNQTFAFGPSDVPEHERCELTADGALIEPAPGRTCRSVSLHRVDLGGPQGFRHAGPTAQAWVQIIIEWAQFDGPNTQFSAAFPWASYYARCHHCLPSDAEIADFLQRLHDHYNDGYGSFGGDGEIAPEPATEEAAEPDQEEAAAAAEEVTEDEVAADVAEALAPDDEETREAAVVAIVAALAAAGLLGTSLAEVGLSVPQLVEAWRRGGASAVDAAIAARTGPEPAGADLAEEMAVGADEEAGVGGDELYGGPPNDEPAAPAEVQVVHASPEASVQARSQPDGTVVFETVDADGTVVGTEVVDPETGEVVERSGTPYAASNWTSDPGEVARDTVARERAEDLTRGGVEEVGPGEMVPAVGEDGETRDSDVDMLLDQPDPDAHIVDGQVPDAPTLDPDAVRNPPAGPLTPEAAETARQTGADGRGRIFDLNGNHIATIGADGVPRNMDGQPVVIVADEGTRILGWSDGDRVIQYDQNGVPQRVDRTWDTSDTRVPEVRVWTEVTVDADGWVTDADGQVIGRQHGPRDVRDLEGNRLPVDTEGDRMSVEQRIDVRDPRERVVSERSGVDDVPRAGPAGEPGAEGPPVTRHDLSDDVRLRWDQLRAGPNGQIYGPDGQVVATVDRDGVLRADDGTVLHGTRMEGGRLTEAWTEDGQRIAGDGSPLPPMDRSGDLPEGVVRTEDGWRVPDAEPTRVADPDLARLGDGTAPRHPDAPAVPVDDGATPEGQTVEGPAVEGPAVEGPAVEGPAVEGPAVPAGADTTITPGDAPTPTGDTTVTPADAPTPTGDTTVTPADAPTPTGDTTVTPADAPTPTEGDVAAPTVDAEGVRAATAGGFTDARTRFDSFLGSRNVDRMGKLAQLTSLTEQYQREGLSFEEAATRAAVETWGGDVVGDIISGSHGVTAPGISVVGGAFLPPRLRGVMPDQFGAEILRGGMRLGDAVMSDDPGAVDAAWEQIRNDPNGSVIRGIAEAGWEAGDYLGDDTQAAVTAQDLAEATEANIEQFGQDAQAGQYGTVLRGWGEMTSFAGWMASGESTDWEGIGRDLSTLWNHADWHVSDGTVQAIQQTPIVGDAVTLAQNAPAFAARAEEAFWSWWGS